MSTAPRLVPRYTVADYLSWEGEWQLIDGVAVAMTPSPFGRHERLVSNFIHEFMGACEDAGCDCRAYAGLDWVVDEMTVVRPDVMIVCGPQPERHLRQRPELVVEVVSPATRLQDRVVKREIYGEQGVPCYLLVESLTETEAAITVFSLDAHEYVERPAAERLDLELHPGCRIVLDRSRLTR